MGVILSFSSRTEFELPVRAFFLPEKPLEDTPNPGELLVTFRLYYGRAESILCIQNRRCVRDDLALARQVAGNLDVGFPAVEVCSEMGLNPEPIGYQQVSDGRFFAERGIPTVLLGPGTAELAHTPDEHVPVAAVIEAAKIYALTAIRLLGAV